MSAKKAASAVREAVTDLGFRTKDLGVALSDYQGGFFLMFDGHEYVVVVSDTDSSPRIKA